jgi:poly-gamma-glutamate synthesis protein (capsule biosynthesis protein)
VIKEVNGVRIAFLAYNSILPSHYWAEANRPGCTPMRAFTVYEQVEHDQPGTPARVHTFAHREDLAAMEADIRAAKAEADVVVMSIHWGIHFVPAVIADYQREVAHAAIDAGADLILGGHAHILKGVEVYRGRTIFYSLCNFAMDIRISREHAQGKGFKEIQALSPGWIPDYDSLYGFPPDTRMTVIVRAELTPAGVRSVGVRPAFINRMAQAEVLTAGDERFGKVVDYLRWATEAVGFNARFEPRGDLVAITAAE